jgi:hypothetical protein
MENKIKGEKRKREDDEEMSNDEDIKQEVKKVKWTFKPPKCGHPEYWRWSATFFPKYEFSSWGRFRLKDKPDQINNGHCTYSGYIVFFLCGENGGEKRSHVCVLTVFKGPKPDPNMTADHINRIRDHNCICNLVWATRVQQNQNQNHSNKKGTPRRVLVEDKNGETQVFESVKNTSQKLKISTPRIRRAIKKNKRIKEGYKFSFYHEIDVNSKEWKTYTIGEVDYKISSDGWVQLKSGRITRGTPNSNGYLTAYINDGRKSLHFLVMMAFLPRHDWRESKLTINHKNKKRDDNRIENLEWLSIREQNIHAQGRKINKWSKDGKVLLATYPAISIAAEKNNLNTSSVFRVLSGMYQSAGGCYYSYDD